MTANLCVWCLRPESDHGNGLDRPFLLCPGKTSSYFTPIRSESMLSESDKRAVMDMMTEDREEIQRLRAKVKVLADSLRVLAGPAETSMAETAVSSDSPVTVRCQLGDLRRAHAALANIR